MYLVLYVICMHYAYYSSKMSIKIKFSRAYDEWGGVPPGYAPATSPSHQTTSETEDQHPPIVPDEFGIRDTFI